jgi:HEAT repeat protein
MVYFPPPPWGSLRPNLHGSVRHWYGKPAAGSCCTGKERGPAGCPAFSRSARRYRYRVRLSATTALGNLKSGRPVDELIGRLRDRSEERVIREQAARALTSIRSTGALRGLREFVADETEDPVLRTYSGNLLKDIGTL